MRTFVKGGFDVAFQPDRDLTFFRGVLWNFQHSKLKDGERLLLEVIKCHHRQSR